MRAWLWGMVTVALASGVIAAEPPHPGSALYATHCAACHDRPTDVRTPDTASLRRMNGQALRTVLTQGVMQPQAAAIPRQELRLLIDYLAARESDSGEWLAGMRCAPGERNVRLDQPVALSTFGVDLHNSRRMTMEQAGLGSAQLADLELAWAIGFPDTHSLRSAPVIVGRTMFYTPVQTHRLLALDVDIPCVKWVYEAGTELRSSLTYGTAGSDARPALIFADQLGRVHAVDPTDGSRIWMVEGRHTTAGTITGTPVAHGRRIIVPVSASGVGRALDPAYECCGEHGAVVALDAATGRPLWTYHTMADAQHTGRTNRLGVRMRGPSGAPIWSTPAIDVERGVIYATTGQNTSLPATDTSDAVLAIDLETGELRWGFQALANDVWNMSCRIPWERSGPNCPSPEESVLKDFDFGAGAIIVPRADGRDILLAGQKSGDVWALDPDTGRLLWNTRFGQGTPLGGIHWGLASDGERVFAAINDPDFDAPGYRAEPGMNALRIDTGEVLWRQPVAPDCSDARRARFARCHERYGLSAAPLVVDRSVIAATLDGRLFVYDAATGEVVFEYDTLRDFDTVNGVPGKGGSVDAHSLFAGAGMVFVGSGYASFGQAPGNVLLAFKPRRSPR